MILSYLIEPGPNWTIRLVSAERQISLEKHLLSEFGRYLSLVQVSIEEAVNVTLVFSDQLFEGLIAVRERRPEFVRGLALGQLRRDLLREGLLREHTADGARIDVADARGILDYMTERQRTSTYPYHWPALSAWLGAPRATQQTWGPG